MRLTLFRVSPYRWQEWRDSNPQPPVLETGALPVELHSSRSHLLNNSCDDAGADGAAALADGEAEFFFHGDRHNQLDLHFDIIPRHHHFRARRQVHNTRHIRCTEVKLRTVIGKERRMTAALFLRQNIGFRLELRMYAA